MADNNISITMANNSNEDTTQVSELLIPTITDTTMVLDKHLENNGISLIDMGLVDNREFLDVGGAVAFKKRLDKSGKLVDTLEHSDEDEIALDYRTIQELFGTDFYTVYQICNN